MFARCSAASIAAPSVTRNGMAWVGDGPGSSTS